MADQPENQNALNQGRNFVWHEITTADTEGSVAFYTGALDFGYLEMDMGDMGPYKMLTRGGIPVCGVANAHSGLAPHWAVYIGVDDVDARLATAEALGATVVVPAMDVPTVGRMVMIKDPQGAYVWLFKPNPQM